MRLDLSVLQVRKVTQPTAIRSWPFPPCDMSGELRGCDSEAEFQLPDLDGTLAVFGSAHVMAGFRPAPAAPTPRIRAPSPFPAVLSTKARDAMCQPARLGLRCTGFSRAAP